KGLVPRRFRRRYRRRTVQAHPCASQEEGIEMRCEFDGNRAGDVERPFARPEGMSSFEAPPVAVPHPSYAESSALKLLVRGFNPMERALLDGTVRLSRRRAPLLQLLSESDVDAADVVMIDVRDASAMEWAHATPALKGKPVIWVDADSAGLGHTAVRRPVQWPVLPMLLARALKQELA